MNLVKTHRSGKEIVKGRGEMSNKWNTTDQTPPMDVVVAIIGQHRKKNGWLSIEINFGTTRKSTNSHYPNKWCVWNNDDRGFGGEQWTPDADFSHWAIPSDVIEVPELEKL